MSADNDDMEVGIAPVSESSESWLGRRNISLERGMEDKATYRNLRDGCKEELEDIAWRGLLMFCPEIILSGMSKIFRIQKANQTDMFCKGI